MKMIQTICLQRTEQNWNRNVKKIPFMLIEHVHLG